ncbi:hypothetical protein ABVT39_023756 [Epinephelus coioides]
MAVNSEFLGSVHYECTDLRLIKEMPIFANERIKYNDRCLYNKKMINAGIRQLKDIIYEFMPGFLSPRAIFEYDDCVSYASIENMYNNILKSIPPRWRDVIEMECVCGSEDKIPDLFVKSGENWKMFNIMKLKELYEWFLQVLQTGGEGGEERSDHEEQSQGESDEEASPNGPEGEEQRRAGETGDEEERMQEEEEQDGAGETAEETPMEGGKEDADNLMDGGKQENGAGGKRMGEGLEGVSTEGQGGGSGGTTEDTGVGMTELDWSVSDVTDSDGDTMEKVGQVRKRLITKRQVKRLDVAKKKITK